MTTVTLYNGDCIDVMRSKIAAESVDCILTDPPYGISFQSNRSKDGPVHRKIKNDNLPFIWFLPEAYRVMKEGSSLVVFCRWDTQEQFRLGIECAGFEIKNQLVWNRMWHGMGDLTGNFAPAHDVAWFATKGKFHLPRSRPKTVLNFKRPSPSESFHPTQKPIDMMEHLIESLVPDKGIVLDPFFGSGSTIVAAKNLNVDCIGIELDSEYFNKVDSMVNRNDLTELLA